MCGTTLKMETIRKATAIYTLSITEKGQVILLGNWPHTVKSARQLPDGRYKVILVRGL